MDGDSIDGIINTLLDKDVGEPKVEKASDEANNNGRPWFHEGTPGGDTNEATETAIHGKVKVECGLSGLAFDVNKVGKEGGDASRRSG